MKLSALAGVLLIGSVPGCSGSTDAMDSKRVVDSSGGSVALGLDSARTYRPMAVSATGSVGGTVSLQAASANSADSANSNGSADSARSNGSVERDPTSCDDSATVSDLRMNPSSHTRVLVWVDGIGAGKPTSGVRRETVVIERCRFAPRLLAVAAGSTINFFSRDALTQTSRFYREGSDEPLDEVRTMDAGQVVPSEKIARLPGMVEARGIHHGSRGYIAVFDHPYFAITDESGSFTIDSLPPGTYTVKLWHERMAAPTAQRVVVTAGGRGHLDVTLTVD